MPERTAPIRETPAPVLYAQKAIALLRAGDAAQADRVEKILPGYALSLARAGEDVTVETLLAAAKLGPEHLKRPAGPAKIQEDMLSAYNRIVAEFDPYLEMTVQKKFELACQKGDTAKIKEYIDHGADVTEGDNFAIKRAAEYGHTETVKFLIDHGADITADNNNTFIWAARNGHIETVKLIIGLGADITAEDNFAIKKAAYNGHTEIVKLLIDHGADITAGNNSALVWAARLGHLETVKLLINHGADVTADNNSAVIGAANNGHMEIVRLLIDHDANVTADNNNAITWAARYGHTETVKLLIDHGADITADNNHAVIWAAQNGHAETVQLLIDHGADVTADNNYAIRCASGSGRTEIIKILIDHGADVTAGNNSAIKNAARHGHTEIIKLLIDHGVDVTAGDNFPIKEAAENGDTEIVRLLIDHGADVTSGDNYALKQAAQNRHTEIVKLLTDHGADITALSKESRRSFNAYIKTEKLWQKTVRMAPPPRLHEQNPVWFKKSVFEALVPLLIKEGYIGKEGAVMAFHAAGLFQSAQRVLQYLELWGKAGKQPLHDLVQVIKLPQNGTPNLKDWGDAVLKCGPSMARLVKFADKISSPCKSSDGKTWSMINTRAECAKFSFKKAAEHPALAALCFEHQVEENDFNEALKMTKKNIPAAKAIPEMTIEGKQFGLDGAKFYRLPANDIRGLFLGEMTNCCQSIGGAGSSCAAHGYTSKDSGFYVVENAKGKIVAQSWAWRGMHGEMCLDSLETLGQNVTAEQWAAILTEAAQELSRRADHDITALHVGTGGRTPNDTLRRKFSLAATNATPKDYNGYRDSKDGQIIVWKRSFG